MQLFLLQLLRISILPMLACSVPSPQLPTRSGAMTYDLNSNIETCDTF